MKNHIQARYTMESSNSCNLSCGNGKEAIQAALLTGAAGIVVGLDITQAMLNTALLNSEGIDISNIRFIKSDLASLPFPDSVFDAVISNCVINHARNKQRVYQEIFRVLKNGGRCVVSDPVTKIPLPLTITEASENWAQCFGGAITEEDYLENILSTGFKSIEILKRRDYIKNGYDFISLTIRTYK